MIKKINIFLVLLLLLVSIGAVSASDDFNSTVSSSDEAISDLSTSEVDTTLSVSTDVADNEVLSSNTYTITKDNYLTYFSPKGVLNPNAGINNGDTLILDGNFEKRNFTFKKPLNIVGSSTNNMKNCVIKVFSGASGSNITNLRITNTYDYHYGIFLDSACNCTVRDCFINNTGQSSYCICVANNATGNRVTNNVFSAYGETYGHGTRSTPPVLLSGAHYNYIENNYIYCDDANAIYLSSYEGGPLDGGVSTYNTIFNNTVKYNVLPTSWAYGIQVMGGYNLIDSNTVIGSYRGICTQQPGNIIVNNKIINLTGADYNNPGIENGGDVGIVASYNSTVRNNQIINAKIISTGTGISALDNSVIENNYVDVHLQGTGMHPQGSNVTIRNNTIITETGSGILYDTKSNYLYVLNNNISSQSGIGVLIQKVSNKNMPGYLTITGNTISTSNTYAIDAAEANANTTNVIKKNTVIGGGKIRTPEGSYDPTKPIYNFNGTVYNINPSNYGTYINDNGGLSSNIKDGDILSFSGEFVNKNIIFVNSAIKITGNNAIFYNTTFRVLCDGVWIENLVIRNNKADRVNAWGVHVFRVSSATVTNCDIEVYDPNAAYAIYVVESSGVDIVNNTLFSSGNYLTYTLLAYAAEDCTFINNTINTIGTGVIHKFESEHCLDGDDACLDGDTACLDGDTACLDGDTACLDGDTSSTNGDYSCLDGDTSCLDGDTIADGNHVLNEVYRTYGILMAYSSDNVVSGNKVNITSKLQGAVSPLNSTNSIVGIDSYYNCQNNIFSDNEVYVKAYDNYIYGMGVLGYITGHDAPEGQGAINNQFINNYIVLEGTYFVQGIVIGDESWDTLIQDNIVYLKSNNVAYGVNLEMSQRSTIVNNAFTLNSDAVYAIEAFTSDDNVIDYNQIEANAKKAYGILFSKAKSNSVTNNFIYLNTTGEDIGINFDSIPAGNAGIFLKSDSTNNDITDNNITSLKGYAIIVDDNAIDNVISTNYLDSEKGIGDKAVNNTANNVVENNYKYVFKGKLSPVSVNYLETADITLQVDDGATVKFYIGSTEIGTATSSNGKATLTYAFGESYTPKKYTIKAVASKEDYLTKTFTSTLTVNKGNFDVEFNDVSARKSTKSNFEAVVKDSLGNPVSGVNVKFYRFQSKYWFLGEATTDANGVASTLVDTTTLENGEYLISANVTGNDKFNSVSSQATLFINNAGIKVGLDDVSAYISTKADFTATVTDSDNAGISGLNVKFYLLDGNVLVGQATTNANGVATINADTSKLAVGNYAISANVTGTSQYDAVSKQATLNVEKYDLDFAFDDVSLTYNDGSELVATLTNAVTGKAISGANVVININNVDTALKTDSKGQVKLSTNGLTPNTYVATVSYKGNSKYNPTSATANVVVGKAPLSISAEDVSAIYKDGSELTVTLTNVATGKAISGASIVVKINGAKYTIKTDSKGNAVFSTDQLTPGSYVAAISYAGNAKYLKATTSANVVVSKAPLDISAGDVSITNGSGELVATLTNGISGKAISSAKIVMDLNGQSYSAKTDSKGQAKFTISGLASGSYVATVSYAGNAKYDAASTTANVDVLGKNKINIVASDISVIYNDDSELSAKLTNVATGKAVSNAKVVAVINGKTYTAKTDSKGIVKFSTNGLAPGSYVATISYEGNSKYDPSSTTANIEVTKAPTSLSASDVSGGEDLVVTLTNVASDKLISGANVVIKINTQKFTIKTDSNGQVRLSISELDLDSGSYTASISYAGNAKYTKSSTTASIVVA